MRLGMSRVSVAIQFWDSAERATLVASNLYEQLLGRQPTAREIELVTVELAMTGQTLGLTLEVLASADYSARRSSNVAFVESLYQDILWREADPLGQQSWLTRLDNSAPRELVAAVIQRSPEAWNRVVDGVFEDFLDRDAELKEIDIWQTLLSSSALSERDLALSILSSDEYYERSIP